MRGAQLPLSAERRHTLPAPHLFGNQPAPLRPCFSASFSLRHRTTLLCDDHSPQDAVHVALTSFQRLRCKSWRGIQRDRIIAIMSKQDRKYFLDKLDEQ